LDWGSISIFYIWLHLAVSSEISEKNLLCAILSRSDTISSSGIIRSSEEKSISSHEMKSGSYLSRYDIDAMRVMDIRSILLASWSVELFVGQLLCMYTKWKSIQIWSGSISSVSCQILYEDIESGMWREWGFRLLSYNLHRLPLIILCHQCLYRLVMIRESEVLLVILLAR
jgi:hypothetical protein